MRGEQNLRMVGDTVGRGSPPHARGADKRLMGCSGASGITPACAGSSVVSVSGWWEKRDHPRMRGEQALGIPISVANMGSPPHARGAVLLKSASCRHCGITPACAGSSEEVHQLHGVAQDHPRMRGEQRLRWLSGSGCRGSPPHARGAVLVTDGERGKVGITPACAGSRREHWQEVRR